MTEPNKNVKDLRTYRSLRSIKSLKIKKSTRISRTHVIMDIYKCDERTLAKTQFLEQKIKKLLNEFQLEPKIKIFYQFQPFGVTAVVYSPGLQFTIHTWPEHQSAAIDLYSFKGRKAATQICEQLQQIFKAGEYEMKVRRR